MISKMKKVVSEARLIMNSENPRARKWLMQSRKSDNPAFALLNAWTEFEYQIKNYNLKKYKNSVIKSRFMIDECAEVLNLSELDVNHLFQIRDIRNGISHGLIERPDPDWKDVVFLLELVKSYRACMMNLGKQKIMEEE